jgi:hypothetical protein
VASPKAFTEGIVFAAPGIQLIFSQADCTPQSSAPRHPHAHHECQRKRRQHGGIEGGQRGAVPVGDCMTPLIMSILRCEKGAAALVGDTINLIIHDGPAWLERERHRAVM